MAAVYFFELYSYCLMLEKGKLRRFLIGRGSLFYFLSLMIFERGLYILAVRFQPSNKFFYDCRVDNFIESGTEIFFN